MSVCRFCLNSKPRKDITDLVSNYDDSKSHTEIILFCIGTQVEEDSKVSTKLCMKCFKKTIEFFEFKTLALKNEAYLKYGNGRTDCKNEAKDEIKASEFASVHITDLIVKEEPKTEEDSEDESLSVIQKIKYEHLEDSENASIKNQSIKPLETKPRKVCEQCGKHVQYLKRHALSHLRAEQRKKRQQNNCKCEFCGQIFASAKLKGVHRRRKHTLRPKKECPICHTEVWHVTQHIRRVHDKVKPHLCQYCSKCFSQKNHLQVHIRTHTKEKPYMCVTCGKFFKTRSIMKTHMLTHSDEKKYACTICNKTFMIVAYLNAHMLSHTKEKRFPCQYCGAVFHRSDNRKRHEIQAHLKKGSPRI